MGNKNSKKDNAHGNYPVIKYVPVDHSDHRGWIKLYIGPMYAGKTTAMLNEVERFLLIKKKCVVIKWSGDTRYDHKASHGGIVTHQGVEWHNVPVITTDSLSNISSQLKEYDVIGISELQFFKDLLVADDLANSGKIVICDALDGTFQRKTFNQLHDIFPKCEFIVKLHGFCACGREACFTKKISGDMDCIEDVGGDDKYISQCRNCYLI